MQRAVNRTDLVVVCRVEGVDAFLSSHIPDFYRLVTPPGRVARTQKMNNHTRRYADSCRPMLQLLRIERRSTAVSEKKEEPVQRLHYSEGKLGLFSCCLDVNMCSGLSLFFFVVTPNLLLIVTN